MKQTSGSLFNGRMKEIMNSRMHIVRKRSLIFAVIAVVLLLTSCNRRYGAAGYVPRSGEEQYFILLSHPSLNAVFTQNDHPPKLEWNSYKDMPYTRTVEIDCLHDGSFLSREVTGARNVYQLTSEEWEMIIKDSPVSDGVQKINWRIRIDYSTDKNKEPYYSAWGSFLIIP